MLRPGLAASLRGITQTRSTRLALNTVIDGFPSRWIAITRLAQPRIPLRSTPFQTNLPYRPLTTSSTLTARFRQTFRRRDPIPRQPQRYQSLAHNVEQELSHGEQPPPPLSDVQAPSISRALLFLFGFSALSFTGAAYYSLRDTEHIASELRSARDVFANISSFFQSTDTGPDQVWGSGITEKRLLVAKNQETAERLGLRMQWLMRWCEQLHLPESVSEVIGRSYIMCAEAYLELPPSKQALVPIIGINAAVFLAWTLAGMRRGGGGGMQRFMVREFLHRPSANRMRTMVTSVFSHQGALHFLFNNMALWSIGGSALVFALHRSTSVELIPEASYTPHFLAFFATAGVFAATVSHVVSAVRFRRIAAVLGEAMAKSTVGRSASLGASGAVYSALVMSAFAFPDAKVGLILLPFISFPIGMGVAGLVAADVAGIVLGWRMFDHWAHLGGAVFGWWYYHYGVSGWEGLKKVLLERMRAQQRQLQVQ